jgi:hypothetical protein
MAAQHIFFKHPPLQLHALITVQGKAWSSDSEWERVNETAHFVTFQPVHHQGIGKVCLRAARIFKRVQVDPSKKLVEKWKETPVDGPVCTRPLQRTTAILNISVYVQMDGFNAHLTRNLEEIRTLRAPWLSTSRVPGSVYGPLCEDRYEPPRHLFPSIQTPLEQPCTSNTLVKHWNSIPPHPHLLYDLSIQSRSCLHSFSPRLARCASPYCTYSHKVPSWVFIQPRRTPSACRACVLQCFFDTRPCRRPVKTKHITRYLPPACACLCPFLPDHNTHNEHPNRARGVQSHEADGRAHEVQESMRGARSEGDVRRLSLCLRRRQWNKHRIAPSPRLRGSARTRRVLLGCTALHALEAARSAQYAPIDKCSKRFLAVESYKCSPDFF